MRERARISTKRSQNNNANMRKLLLSMRHESPDIFTFDFMLLHIEKLSASPDLFSRSLFTSLVGGKIIFLAHDRMLSSSKNFVNAGNYCQVFFSSEMISQLIIDSRCLFQYIFFIQPAL